MKLRAREHLSALTRREDIAFEGGRFVIVQANEQLCVVALQGLIGWDASAKFRDVERRLEQAHCGSRWLMLESPGGGLQDGLALAKEVRTEDFRTVARYDCASACALVFVAGSERVLVGSAARIGFHQAASQRIGSDERHCSDSFNVEIRRHLSWVIPEHADEVMAILRKTSCRSIEWLSGQRALDLRVATRVESQDVDIFNAKSAPNRAGRAAAALPADRTADPNLPR